MGLRRAACLAIVAHLRPAVVTWVDWEYQNTIKDLPSAMFAFMFLFIFSFMGIFLFSFVFASILFFMFILVRTLTTTFITIFLFFRFIFMVLFISSTLRIFVIFKKMAKTRGC
jgi:uncharacterized membrane protein